MTRPMFRPLPKVVPGGLATLQGIQQEEPEEVKTLRKEVHRIRRVRLVQAVNRDIREQAEP